MKAASPSRTLNLAGYKTACSTDMHDHCMAKAVYDNLAEAPEELAFRKGDVLTVLEQNVNGLEGWWLCSLRGRQGICPGNRLRLLIGWQAKKPNGIVNGETTKNGYVNVNTTEAIEAPANGCLAHRRSWYSSPNKIVTPQKFGNVYLYDVPPTPPSSCNSISPRQCRQPSPAPSSVLSRTQSPLVVSVEYDSPRINEFVSPPSSTCYDTPISHYKTLPVKQDAYDVPRQNETNLRIVECDPNEAYDVPIFNPATVLPASDKNVQYDSVPKSKNFLRSNNTNACNVPLPMSNRSSGVSVLSTTSSSSFQSPSSSSSSGSDRMMTPSISLSSFGGRDHKSNRSSFDHSGVDMYDIPPSEVRRVADQGDTRSGTSEIGRVADLEEYDTPAPEIRRVIAEDTPPPLERKRNSPFGKPRVKPKPEIYDTPQPLKLQKEELLTDSGGDSEELSPERDKTSEMLDLDVALDRLGKLHQGLSHATRELFAHSTLNPPSSCCPTKRIGDTGANAVVRGVCMNFESALSAFADFSRGALVSARDKAVCARLTQLLEPVVKTEAAVRETCLCLKDKEMVNNRIYEKISCTDELDQLVIFARTLSEDARQLASFIQGNATLLFKRAKPKFMNGNSYRPLPAVPANAGKIGTKRATRALSGELIENTYENDSKQWEMEQDYDYVNLEKRNSDQEEVKSMLSPDLQKSFDNLVQQSKVLVDIPVQEKLTTPAKASQPCVKLEPKDRQLLSFYSKQYDSHIAFLTNAIDVFLRTVRTNEPPKVFVAHVKFVILSAHKLVYIGDTVHRNVLAADVRNQVRKATDSLCDLLKETVHHTKTAALQFPMVAAVQAMVDSVVDVSHAANQLMVAFNQSQVSKLATEG